MRVVFCGDTNIRKEKWRSYSQPKEWGKKKQYNIKEDPTEQDNLAAKMPEKVSELDARYRKWIASQAAKVK